jgi:hypothetical protein
MDVLETTYDIRKVKTTLVSKAVKKEFKDTNCEYDDYLDTAFVRFAEPSEDEFTFFLDRNMALIIREVDNEVVALMIEEYEAEYIKMNKKLASHKPEPECIDATEIFQGNKRLQRVLEMA